ncbi:MAG: hypothetical protein PWQ82_1043 [Thermosediminibacterales bacterium]|nr:hypothetical protein [Thermosediminibacterales bacterium]MDK2836713.1 hypothetical protein [Thermosediminibacterales bacterium]
MERTLELIFVNAAGRNTRFTLDDPKAGLTSTEVETVMNDIIARNIFNSTGGNLVSIGGARIVTREVTELISA